MGWGIDLLLLPLCRCWTDVLRCPCPVAGPYLQQQRLAPSAACGLGRAGPTTTEEPGWTALMSWSSAPGPPACHWQPVLPCPAAGRSIALCAGADAWE
ncbi:hypothetical protein V8C86DRAFT_2571780 [Haematococcus lacustris]